MKTLLIVSTGRCGTTRLAEILKKYAPEDFKVVHQVKSSRLSNVIGNILVKTGGGDFLKKWLIGKILPSDNKNFITTDPLVSLVIPSEMIDSKDVSIVHLVRDREGFATSFYKFTRKKINSFIAHNFIPFWQPKVFLFENLIKGEKIKNKYEEVAKLKEELFDEVYGTNPHYVKFSMKEAFENDVLLLHISNFFNIELNVPSTEFGLKSNQSS